jgi:hypothetical protein
MSLNISGMHTLRVVCNKYDLFFIKSLPDYHKAAITWNVHHSKAVSRKPEPK